MTGAEALQKTLLRINNIQCQQNTSTVPYYVCNDTFHAMLILSFVLVFSSTECGTYAGKMYRSPALGTVLNCGDSLS